jgi:hypothetical protein
MVMLRGEREVEVELSLLTSEMRRNTTRLDKKYFPWHMMGCKDMLESRFAKAAFTNPRIYDEKMAQAWGYSNSATNYRISNIVIGYSRNIPSR